jgi:hypothetical protein
MRDGQAFTKSTTQLLVRGCQLLSFGNQVGELDFQEVQHTKIQHYKCRFYVSSCSD